MKRLFVLIFISQFLIQGVSAKVRTQSQITETARKTINTMVQRQHMAPRQGELKTLHSTNAITVKGYENGGFAVIANDDAMPEVLGISDAQFSGTANPGFEWWLKAINEVCQSAVARDAAYASNVPTPEDLGFEPRVDPIVAAEWDQEAPYSDMCPKSRTGRRCLTGCVATAIAQVLYTHKTPVVGCGSRTNNKSYSSMNSNGSYEDVTFNYDDFVPDYDNMINLYTSGPKADQYTDAQARAVAELMLACGVAVNMDYGSDGSGAYTDQAAEGLIQYMGITTADFKERDYYSDVEWMTMVYEELAGGHAMYYSAVDSNPWTGGGHAFVCDGYDENGKVHINWGWSGNDNGFYNINLLNPTSYQFSEYQDFIRGLWDPSQSSGSGIDYITLRLQDVAPGCLADSIGVDNFMALRSLTVTGELNNDDIALLSTLASGADLTDLGTEGNGHLSILDLSDAILPKNEISDKAFKDCSVLTTVRLPRNLERIGTNAFAGCSHLNRIYSYTYNVPKMGTRVFDGVSSANMKLYLIAGSSEYYRRNAQWKTIITTNNITEFGTCLKAKNKTLEAGKPMPVFGFQITGDRVIGTPHLWTDATEESEPGKYTIFIEAGTIEDSKNVVFVNGVLTLTEPAPEGISNVKADCQPAEEYSISGLRMKGNTQRGFIIQNGQKIVR